MGLEEIFIVHCNWGNSVSENGPKYIDRAEVELFLSMPFLHLTSSSSWPDMLVVRRAFNSATAMDPVTCVGTHNFQVQHAIYHSTFPPHPIPVH